MSQDRKREQEQKPGQTPVIPAPPVTVSPPDGGLQGSLQRLEEQQKALEDRLAVATRQILEKGLLSSSAGEAEQRLRQNQQQTGE